MRRRRSNLYRGLDFTVACIVLGVLLYGALVREHPATENAVAAASPAPEISRFDDLPSVEASSLPSTPTIASAPTGSAETGRCHMGECSWSRTVASNAIRTEGDNRLVRLDLIGGTSTDEEGARIRWAKAPHAVYVFCSRVLPATMLAVDGGWQVDALDFVSGNPDILMTSVMIYERTCHPGDRRLFDDAAALGYRSFAEGPPELTINSPIDMFEQARSFSAHPVSEEAP